MSQLLADCLNEIFEYLDDDKISLHSCLLVNRLWCQISVRILWRDIQNFSSLYFNTLISCLPDESKRILSSNGIKISTTTLKPPIFNYAAFCKVVSIAYIETYAKNFLENQPFISSYKINIMSQEIFKLFIKQAISLKKLIIYNSPTIQFISYPELNDCLKNLTELHCSSNTSPEFFYQLSKMCFNIQSITVDCERMILNGLVYLISVQKNLKYFELSDLYNLKHEERILISSLMSQLPNTLTNLKLHIFNYISLSFIHKFSNLQELELSLDYGEISEITEKAQYAIFPYLQVLIFKYKCPGYNFLSKFLENNGKNLKELNVVCYSNDYLLNLSNLAITNDNSLNLVIAKFCPKLQKLYTKINCNELESLKIIFINCQHLESIKICFGDELLREKEVLEMIVNYSQKIYEVLLCHQFIVHYKLLPNELESFFISWSNNNPSRKSLSLFVATNIYCRSLDKCDENMEIIKKYTKLGVIEKFEVISLEYGYIY
jgi:hypothetical protein